MNQEENRVNGTRRSHVETDQGHECWRTRNQGLDNKIIRPEFHPPPTHGAIECRNCLGGLLRYSYREAA